MSICCASMTNQFYAGPWGTVRTCALRRAAGYDPKAGCYALTLLMRPFARGPGSQDHGPK